MADTTARAPARLIEFFMAEAAGYVTVLRESLWVSAAERDTGKFLAAARGLRGAAAMARLTDLAVLAGRIERIGRAIHLRRAQWTDPLSYSLQAVGHELPDLIAAAPRWSAEHSAHASAIVAALQPFAPPPESSVTESVLPVARLFHDDDGPHVIYAAVTPQTQFEQQLREPLPERLGDGARRPAAAAPATPPRPPAARSGQTGERPRRPRPGAPESAASAPATPLPRPALAPESQPSTPARGNQLRGLLAESLATFQGLDSSLEADTGAADGPVPIESLVYRGKAARDRAREIRAAHAAGGTEPSREDLDELMDLVELAAEI